MKEDPIIAEVRRVRHRISAQFDHDVRRLCAHYMELEKINRASGKQCYADLPPRVVDSAVHDEPAQMK